MVVSLHPTNRSGVVVLYKLELLDTNVPGFMICFLIIKAHCREPEIRSSCKQVLNDAVEQGC